MSEQSIENEIQAKDLEADGRKMQSHQARVVAEKEDLLLKYGKLHSFVNSDPYYKLSENERNLLSLQLTVMYQYINILEMRILTF